MNANSEPMDTPFAAFIGLDWGDAKHALALREAASQNVERSCLAHSSEEVRTWLLGLQTRFAGKPVALALETSKGPLIHIFHEFAWLVIYPIHPATSARYRRAFTPSGAKDDSPDAMVLLDLLLHHRAKLRPLVQQDTDTRRLSRLCELRRKTVDQRTLLTNQMRSLLKEYFPQALHLVGEVLHSPLALDFLERWTDLISLKAARPATIKRFYFCHNVRSPQAVEDRLSLIQRAQALTTDHAIVSVNIPHLRRLIEQVRLLQKHIAADEKEITAAFKEHPDAHLFRELPGAGATLAPRLLTAFGAERTLFASAEEFQRYSGIAPVKEKSGGRTWIHWRWSAPRFLRQTLIEWVGQSILYCDWAKAYYTQKKAQGKRHWAILRALAFKWLRILWKCWITNTAYDEARYLRALTKHKSPFAINAP